MWISLLLACTSPPPVDAPISEQRTWCEASGQTLGTTYALKWSGACEGVQPAVEAVLETVDQQMSTWRDDSELMEVRQGGRVDVSTDTLSVVRDALALAEATSGAFDPTVQPLMEVWGFHSRDRQLAAPDDEALAMARSSVGWTKVSTGATWVDAGGTALDLSAIAKGHAVDRVSQLLSRTGRANHMVEIGGEVRVAGEGPRGLWSLGVDAPTEGAAPGQSFVAVVQLTNHALATSGNYRNLVEVDGRKVHHTMDPRTGAPAVTDVASVSVVAPTCREADALATAVMVLGSVDGLALLESRSDVEGLVLVSGDELEQRPTSGMAAFLRSTSAAP